MDIQEFAVHVRHMSKSTLRHITFAEVEDIVLGFGPRAPLHTASGREEQQRLRSAYHLIIERI